MGIDNWKIAKKSPKVNFGDFLVYILLHSFIIFFNFGDVMDKLKIFFI